MSMKILKKIASRLTGINKADCTTAERQIINLLIDEGLVEYDDNKDLINIDPPKQSKPKRFSDHLLNEQFLEQKSQVETLSTELDQAVQALVDTYPLVGGAQLCLKDHKVGVFMG